MKKINTLLLALIGTSLLFSGCKKEEEDSPGPDLGPTCTTLLTKSVDVYTPSGGGTSYTGTREFIYNTNKKLVKVTYSYGGYDTLIYDANGNIDSLKSYQQNDDDTPYQTFDYTFTSGKLSSVIEKGNNGAPFTRTRTLTYTSGVLSSITLNYTVGAADDGEPQSITNISYTNGNPTSVSLDGAASTIVIDATAPNPFYGLYSDPEDILAMIAPNNATSAYANAAPSSPYFTKSYTYSNGRVSTITESGEGDEGTTVSTLTYTCL